MRDGGGCLSLSRSKREMEGDICLPPPPLLPPFLARNARRRETVFFHHLPTPSLAWNMRWRGILYLIKLYFIILILVKDWLKPVNWPQPNRLWLVTSSSVCGLVKLDNNMTGSVIGYSLRWQKTELNRTLKHYFLSYVHTDVWPKSKSKVSNWLVQSTYIQMPWYEHQNLKK